MSRTVYSGQDPQEQDLGYVVKATQSQGLNNGGVISFRIPADPERFTDLNSVLLRLEVSVEKSNGEAVADEEPVCIDAEGMHALFETVTVRFNERVVSFMSAYPYTTKLCRMLGMSTSLREGVFDTFDGSRKPSLRKSDLTTDAARNNVWIATNMSRISGGATLIGRVYADVLTSAEQYLPPGIALGVDLRRAPDHFSLQSAVQQAHFRLRISSASLYVKRHRLRPTVLASVSDQIASGGTLNYNNLETRMMSIPKETKVFNWLNCLGSGASLPNRLYITFIGQKSFFGSLGAASTWFEHMHLQRLGLKVGGRDILVDPITTKFVTDANGIVVNKTNAMDGFLSVTEVMDAVRDQTAPLRLSYIDYLFGGVVYAVEFGKNGERTGTVSGAVDIQAEFSRVDEATQVNAGTAEACLMVIFCEKSDQVNLAAALG